MAGKFDAYAVTSPSGPHVTVQAGLVHLGRHWTTATRQSAKVRAVRRHGWASVTTRTAQGWRLIGGPTAILDLAHPSTLARDPFASGLAGGALIRLGLGRLDQLIGYAEAGASVPAAFLPPGRVLLATRIRDELVICGDRLVTVRGRWAGDPAALQRPHRDPPRSWWTPTLFDGVPTAVAELAVRAAGGWLGVHNGHSTVALPALWDPATGRVSVSRSALSAVGAQLPGTVCVTLDDSGRRRPDEKVGVMLRGEGALVDLDAATASVAVAVARLSYWEGFSSGTTRKPGSDQVADDRDTVPSGGSAQAAGAKRTPPKRPKRRRAGAAEWRGAQPGGAGPLQSAEIRLNLPLPGSGSTWERWRQLAEIAAVDLSIARLVEGHTDARAILAELGHAECAADATLGVWAAESTDEPLRAGRDADGTWHLSGRKRWCSGAHRLDAALVTARADDGSRLFLVELGRPGVEPVEGTWPAVGMAGSDSVDVTFSAVELPAANAIGRPGAYLDRPGFWHGGVGVAACWYGGAVGVARALDDATATRPPQAHRLAHRGAVQATLAAMAAVLSDAARQIDTDPDDLPSARRRAYEVRYVIERDCREVLERVGLATGAEPLCHDADHARRVADLTVFLRQWHAEADLERLGLLPMAPRA